ncbi:anti-sigma factor [Thiothrix lacustris]|uniref:anti-sigma factor n=1 Tax=Thiothrix lacustris TaxID=525917 RepID=UPI00048FC934|nr:anti-sigma factor [Thiothrix lacustris]
MKRYQNPEIFEHLAMSYALGTLQGKARLRFEKLQQKHLYLRAVTDAYQQRFSPLVELLPAEKPPAKVWQQISKELKLDQQTSIARSNWLASLKGYLPWSVAAFASIAASVMTVLLLNINSQPAAYMAMMKSPVQQDKMMVAMVSHDAMEISFDMPSGALPDDKGMVPTIWCVPKDKNMPLMRMGTLAKGDDHRMPIDSKVWKDMANVREFAISMEPMNAPESPVPTGAMMFTGELAAW